jgi:cyclase
MSCLRIISSLLIRDNRLVKGKKFKNHIDSGDPVTTCVAYDSQGIDEILMIDLDSYNNLKEPNYEIIEKINKRCNTPFSFGGGIKNEKDALLCIKKGADKILINTNLSKQLVGKISNEIGRASIIGAADIYYDGKKYNLFKNNTKTNIDALEYIKNIMDYEIGELKITYVDREGTRKGFDIEFSKKIQDLCNKPIIFEGGFSDLDDISMAFKNGINSIAIGSLITFSDNNIFMIKQYLENKGFEVRLRK